MSSIVPEPPVLPPDPFDDVLVREEPLPEVEPVPEFDPVPELGSAATDLGPAWRLLLVHAHPDDETIGTGATMAKYAAEGAAVTLITCTRGERGEVIPARLAQLASGADDALGQHRIGELAAAMAALGVRDHRFLGSGPVTAQEAPAQPAPGIVFADSGMAYDDEGMVIPAPDPAPNAFAVADVEEEAEVLTAVLREVRPHVVITYEPGGGYRHPDHVRAHDVTMRAIELAAVAGPAGAAAWTVPKVYWQVMPLSLARAALTAMAQVPDRPGLDPSGRLPSMMVPDDQVTTCIDAVAHTPAKVAALRAHETQVSVTGDDAFFALSNGLFQPIMGLEFYRLAQGQPAPPFDDVGRETDLFSGLT